MKFSIGYNHDIEFLDLLDEYKSNIEAVYFPAPDLYAGSGRGIRQGKDYPAEISKIIRKCSSLNIRSQLLLNATCEGEDGLKRVFFERIVGYIAGLRQRGLTSVVLTNPVYIYEVKKRIRGLEIESSVNCYIKTSEHAKYLRDLGVDILTIDRDINRNIPLIKQIKAETRLPIRILLNEACLRNCPFRHMHYNYIAHASKRRKKKEPRVDPVFLDKWCVKIFSQDPANIFRTSFIPPEAVKYYTHAVDYFKISSRVSPLARLRVQLDAYINKKFEGNLLALLDCPGVGGYYKYIDYKTLKKARFFEKMLQCNGHCRHCGYCEELADRAVAVDSYFLPDTHPVRKEERKKAIALYERVLRNDPRNREVTFALVSCYEADGKYAQAVKLLESEEKLNPGSANISFALARCLKKMGKKENFRLHAEKGFSRINIADYIRKPVAVN
jgi:collagenase-like PrtC family protease